MEMTEKHLTHKKAKRIAILYVEYVESCCKERLHNLQNRLQNLEYVMMVFLLSPSPENLKTKSIRCEAEVTCCDNPRGNRELLLLSR